MNENPILRSNSASMAAPNAQMSGTRRDLAVMFTDIVDSTPLVAELGDEQWLRILGWHDALLRPCFRAHAGVEIKHLGDGFFVVFERACDALWCAQAIQRTLAAERQTVNGDLHIRIGIQWAPVLQRGCDYVGIGVHEAARLSKVGPADAIVMTTSALAAAGVAVPRCQRSMVRLRGQPKPVEVASLRRAGADDLESLAAL